MKELKEIYYKSGIWRKYNWYDFLKDLLEIMQKYERTNNKLNEKI